MEIADKVVVVTGGCSGIGAGLARRFRDEGARAVVVADLRVDGAPEGTIARPCDVARESNVAALVASVLADHGQIDLFCSNAGVLTPGWDVRRARPTSTAGSATGMSTSWRTRMPRRRCFPR